MKIVMAHGHIYQPGRLFLLVIQPADRFIQKGGVERRVREDFFPLPFHGRKDHLGIFCLIVPDQHFHRYAFFPFGHMRDRHRLHGLMKRVLHKIRYHSYDRVWFVHVIKNLAYCSGRIADPIPIGVKGIEAEFITDDHVDRHTGADAQRQPQYIDTGIQLMPGNISPGYLQMIFDHGGILLLFASKSMTNIYRLIINTLNSKAKTIVRL